MVLQNKSFRLLNGLPWSLLLLEVIHFLIRWVLLNAPFFSELDYDEGVIGLMALQLLRGEPQLMLWGLPRMGGFEAYLASFLFFLFQPSTLAIQLSLVIVSGVILLVLFAIGRKLGGPVVGFMAAAYWAVPPVFLSFTGNYVTGGHLEAVLAGALILYGICTFASLSPPKLMVLWMLIGVISGIGWWSSLLVMPFLLVAALGMVGTRPRSLLTPLPWLALAGYLLGSLPFWTWNYFHDFNTLRHLGGKQFISIIRQLPEVISNTLPTFIGTFWDGQAVASIPKPLVLIVLIGFYLPVSLVSLAVFFGWLWRIGSKNVPFQKPLDYVVLAFWAYILVRATGEAEDLGLTRYTLVFFVPLSILVSFWIHKIISLQKILGWGLFFILLGFNFLTNFLYVEQNKNHPIRPVDDLIRTFKELGIRYCYGDSRVTQVITFESQEKIIGADYYGRRNYDYLKKVDRAPVQEMAIVTHRKLGNPFPATLEASLQLLGAGYEKREVGDYVFWYHFREPGPRGRSLPAGEWRVTASRGTEQTPLLKDRDILTAWRLPKKSGEWLQIDLGKLRKVEQISILPGPVDFNVPYQFKLEISTDGRTWKTLKEVKDYIPGMTWFHGRPRLDQDLRIQIVFTPQEGRFFRMTNLDQSSDPNDSWTIAELFIYESRSGTEPPRGQAEKNLDQAQQILDHWMDDPTGPQLSPLRISLDFRKKLVDWPSLIQCVSRAIEAAPDGEDAHQLFGRALMLGEFGNGEGSSPQKSSKNPLDLFSKADLPLDPSKRWRVVSNLNSQEVRLAIDRNPFTRWTSLKHQEPGMFYQVDLGEKNLIKGFSLFLGPSLNDYPRSLKVWSSHDGVNWQENQMTSHPYYAVSQNRLYKKTVYTFSSPIQVRTLKLVQESAAPASWWSIYELEILADRPKR